MGNNRSRNTSGCRYRSGIHDIPDNLVPFLPKSAKILDKQVEVDAVKVEQDIKALDDSRVEGDLVDKKTQAAENRRAAMERARQAKAEKASN